MLRSSHHLAEILRTRPESAANGKSSSSCSQPAWSPRRKLTPGPRQLIKIRQSQPEPTKKISAARKLSEPSAASSSDGADTALEAFTYDRKLTTTDQPSVIRLLEVLPGRKSDPVVCVLQYCPTEHPPDYKAISYCWGGQLPSLNISCNGKPLRITENLSDAIKALRHEDRRQLLWADGICIDQSSVKEKNSQVPLMRLIYQNADSVHIWLGNDTPAQSGREAFGLFRELFHAYQSLTWDFDIFRPAKKAHAIICKRLPALRDPSWISVLEIVQRPWFTRAWIIQEVVVAQRALLHCGDVVLDWNEFCFGFLFAIKAGLLTIRPDTFQHAFRYAQLASLMVTYMCHRESKYQNLDLSSLLQSHRIVEATDPKDKIYALLGLSSTIEGQPHGIVPNYSLSVAEIYTNVSKAIISQCSTLDILGVPRSASNPLIGDVPSWVKDWSLPHIANSLSCTTLQGPHMFNFNATGSPHPNQATFNGSSLILSGHIIDTLKRVGKVMNPFTPAATNELTGPNPSKTRPGLLLHGIHVYTVLQDWRMLLRSAFPHRSYAHTSEGLHEAFCRTLYMDHFDEGYTLPMAIVSFERRGLRVAYHVAAHLARHPRVVRGLNWCEAHRLAGYALLQADRRVGQVQTVASGTQLLGKRILVTEGGFMGLGPDLAEVGDRVVLVKGARVPLLLRPRGDAKWELIGDCYIHGIMNGEAFDEQKCGDIAII